MLLSTHLTLAGSAVVFTDDVVCERCLGEVASLADDLSRSRRFGFISITTRRGYFSTSAALASSRHSALANDVLGFDEGYSAHCCAPSLIPLLLSTNVDNQIPNVGAVLSYTRQPKHIRKNTGGKDWLRVTLRVRERRAMRGLSWRFSRLRALAAGVGVAKGSPGLGYLATASALH